MTGHRLVQQTRDAKIRPFVIAANFPVREDLHQRIAQGRATTLVAIKFRTRSTDKRLVPISRLFLTSLGEQDNQIVDRPRPLAPLPSFRQLPDLFAHLSLISNLPRLITLLVPSSTQQVICIL